MTTQVQFTGVQPFADPGLLADGAGTAAEDGVSADDFSAMLEAGMMMAALSTSPADLEPLLAEPAAGPAGSTAGVAGATDTATSPEQALAPEPLACDAVPRRSNLGGLLSETFPEGWETLLEDDARPAPPAENQPAATAAASPAAPAEPTEPAEPDAALELVLPALDDAAEVHGEAESKSARVLTDVQSKPEAAEAPEPEAEIAPEAETPPPAQAAADQDHAEAALAGRRHQAETIPAPGVSRPDANRSEEQAKEWLPAGPDNLEAAPAAAVRPDSPRAAMAASVRGGEPLGSSRGLHAMSEMQKQMVVTDFIQSTVNGIQGGHETLSLDLNPPELGRIKLVIESRGGEINAHLTAQQQDVGDLFRQNADTIRRGLEAAGIKVGDLSVEVGQPFQQASGERESLPAQPWSSSRIAVGRGPERAAAAGAHAGSRHLAGSGRLDIVI